MNLTVKKIALGLAITAFVLGATASPALAKPTVTPPRPQSPINNALVTTDTPTLRWTASTEKLPGTLNRYEYQVAYDAALLFPVLGASGTTGPGITEDTLAVPLARARTYYWGVRACDNVGPECTDWATATFRVSVDAPNLVSPADGSYLLTNRDTFDWDAVLNATGYQIQISNSSLFNSTIVNTTTAATVTEFTPASDLPVNQILYWRVRATSSAYGPGPWSPVWSFTTANPPYLPPNTPALLQPQDKKMTTDFSPGFLWSKFTLPSGTTFTGYHLQVAEDPDFTILAWDDPLSSTDINTPSGQVDEFSPLNPASTYYWRVRACNTDGVNNFCSSWPAYFTLYTSLDSTTLIAPLDGTLLTENRPVFEWNPITKAMNYIIELATTPTFATVAYRWFSPVTTYRPLSPLPPNVTYYWRIRGGHPLYGPGLSSEVWSFTTANPPARPTLQSPASNALVYTTTPMLTWTFSSTPPGTTFAYYHVQIDDNADFSLPEEDNTSVTNPYTPYFTAGDYSAPLNPVATYYWRVRACNTGPDAIPSTGDDQCSDWSAPRYFRVAAEAPIGLVSAYPLLDWNDVIGAASYTVELYRNGSRYRTFTVNFVSEVNVGVLPPGTYTWKVRVRTTFPGGFAPSDWSATDMFIIP